MHITTTLRYYSNVLCRPRLADFDISVDAAARITETLTLRGTGRFIAPELRLAGARPSPAADMFALGVTISDVVTPLPRQLEKLVSAMCATDPATRPTAGDAVGHPFFAPVSGGQLHQAQQCCLCLCDPPHSHSLANGLRCATSLHFTCDTCLTAHVHHATVAGECDVRCNTLLRHYFTSTLLAYCDLVHVPTRTA